MAVNCDPSTLANAATCFDCDIPPGQQLAVQTYLLAVIAGGSLDPTTLANAARCFQDCIPKGQQLAVQNYLLCQILSK
jgi:hypothetical protein